MSLPRIGITAGDPAGIGPEIARKAMADPRVRAVCEPLYLRIPSSRSQPGVLSAEAGHAAYETIVRAVRDAQAGGIHGIATAPINKEALALAGLPWRGHTEMLASLTNAPNVAMMFWSEKLRVVLATIHIPLASVPAALTIESVSGDHRADQPRAAAVRHRASAAGAGGPQSACRRARRARARRDRCARARRRAEREGGHRHLRSVSRRYDLSARHARRV